MSDSNPEDVTADGVPIVKGMEVFVAYDYPDQRVTTYYKVDDVAGGTVFHAWGETPVDHCYSTRAAAMAGTVARRPLGQRGVGGAEGRAS